MTVSGHHVPIWYDEAIGPANGQGVVWNAATKRWEPGAGGSGGFVTEPPGPTVELDLSSGNKRIVPLESDVVLSITGDSGITTLLVIIETGAGGFSVTWWDGINWGTGSAPTVTAAADKRDVFTLLRLGAGDWLGFVVGQALDVPIVPAVPDAPTGVTATAGNAQADVAFTPGADNGSARTGCRITPYIAGVAQTPQVFTDTATTQTVTGLTNETAYAFVVEDLNDIGYSDPSTASNSVTPSALTVPGAPTSVVATHGNAQASVAFTPPASDGGSAITSYTVTVSPGSHTASGASSPIVVTGLTNGTAYTATVHATNDQGDSAESSPSSSFTPATVPGAPTIGVATAGDTTATANWTAPGSNGGSAVTGYVVKTYAAADDSLLDTDTVGNVLTFGQTGLTNGVDIYFKVAAINVEGTGTQTAASNTVTPAPAAPFGGPTDYGSALRLLVLPDDFGLANGAKVTGAGITDSSASAVVLTGTAFGDLADGPFYRTAQIDGHGAIEFDPARVDLVAFAAGAATAIDNVAIFAVIKCTDTAAARSFFDSASSAAGGFELNGSAISTPGKLGSVLCGVALMDSTVNTPAGFVILAFRRLAGTSNLYANGGPSIATSATAPAAISGAGVLGCSARLPKGFGACWILIERAMSDSDMNDVGGWLVDAAQFPSLTWTDL